MPHSRKVECISVLMAEHINIYSGSDRANYNIIICIKYGIMILCHKVFINCDFGLSSWVFLTVYSSLSEKCFHYF